VNRPRKGDNCSFGATREAMAIGCIYTRVYIIYRNLRLCKLVYSRLPYIGGDLQTVRGCIHSHAHPTECISGQDINSPSDGGSKIHIVKLVFTCTLNRLTQFRLIYIRSKIFVKQ